MNQFYFILSFIFFSFTITSNAQSYVVQVAAFDERVPITYFSKVNGVYLETDQNNIYRYYVGPYSAEIDAEYAKTQAKNVGFQYAEVINLEERKEACSRTCGNISTTREVLTTEVREKIYIRSIFFDFDKANLRLASKNELDRLHTILMQNPTYSADLRAHTDSKGSQKYNVNLSKRRAKSAKDYLLAKGISNARIKTTVYGEDVPIAKNELDGGKDTEEGRQLNRRVELVVLNASGKVIDEMVEDISVPNNLKTGN